MNRPFFSILIPVYGNIEYLDNCLKSIISQSFSDFEIIMCFQGDTHYESPFEDVRIKKIHRDKPSLYLARIESYKQAKGDYVLFIDSDDELFEDSLSTLYDFILQSNNPDIIQFGYSSNKSTVKDNQLKPPKDCLSRKEYLDYFLSNNGTYPIWRKCFKHNEVVFFDADVFMGEDALLSLAFINASNVIMSLDRVLYFYRINKKSGTSNLKVKYLDDLSIFLIKSLPYRDNNTTREMMISSFIDMFFVFLYKTDLSKLLSCENVNKIIEIILEINFKTRPFFVRTMFLNIIKSKRVSFFEKIGFFLFRFFRKRKKVTVEIIGGKSL